MAKKTLLLDASYQVQSFIDFKRALKLLVKDDKVEVISSWEETFNYGNGKMRQPSILRLKNHIKRTYFNSNFSRKALVKRDKSTCQYCSRHLSASNVTIDHVLPRAQGGGTSYSNCVVACQTCNNKKAALTPEQANMKLLRRPTHPTFISLRNAIDHQEHWHKDWDDFLNM
jgi:5-methylcytosine-specific restriction endonuclease McrA